MPGCRSVPSLQELCLQRFCLHLADVAAGEGLSSERAHHEAAEARSFLVHNVPPCFFEEMVHATLTLVNKHFYNPKLKSRRPGMVEVAGWLLGDHVRHLSLDQCRMLCDRAAVPHVFECLGRMPRLQTLAIGRLNFWKIPELATLADRLTGLPHLTTLRLEYICLPPMLKGLAEKCPQLLELSLKDSEKITNQEVPEIMRCHQLRSLNISGTSVTGSGSWDILMALPQLTWFEHCPFNCNSGPFLFDSREEMLSYIWDFLSVDGRAYSASLPSVTRQMAQPPRRREEPPPEAPTAAAEPPAAQAEPAGPGEAAPVEVVDVVSNGPLEADLLAPDGQEEAVPDGPAEAVSEGTSEAVQDGLAEAAPDGPGEAAAVERSSDSSGAPEVAPEAVAKAAAMVAGTSAEATPESPVSVPSGEREEMAPEGAAETSQGRVAEAAADGAAEVALDGPAEADPDRPADSASAELPEAAAAEDPRDEQAEDTAGPPSAARPAGDGGPVPPEGREPSPAAREPSVGTDRSSASSSSRRASPFPVSRSSSSSLAPRIFAIENFWLFNPKTEEVALAHLCPAVRQLRLDFVFQDIGQSPDLAGLAQFRLVTQLEINSFDAPRFSVLSEVLRQLGDQLTTLALHVCDDYTATAALENAVARWCPRLERYAFTGDYSVRLPAERGDDELDFGRLRRRHPQLRELSLGGFVTGRRLLFLLAHAPALRTLRLDGELRHLDDAGFRQVLAVNPLSQLEELWVNVSSGLTLEAVLPLVFEPNCRLRRLGRLSSLAGLDRQQFVELRAQVRAVNLDVDLVWVTPGV